MDPTHTSFDEVPRVHGSALYRCALQLAGNRSDALDLVQSTYERALSRGLDGVPPQKVRAWLMVILRNQFVDGYRARQRHPLADEAAVEALVVEQDDEEAPWRQYHTEDLVRALGGLSPILRRAYEMHAFEGMEYGTIAARLRIPLPTVGTRLRRARAQLRRALEEGTRCTPLASARPAAAVRAPAALKLAA